MIDPLAHRLPVPKSARVAARQPVKGGRKTGRDRAGKDPQGEESQDGSDELALDGQGRSIPADDAGTRLDFLA